MFQEVRRPNGDLDQVNDYKELMMAFDCIIARSGTEIRCYQRLSRGVPMYAVLTLFCSTLSGYNLFANAEVSVQLCKIFDVGGEFSVPLPVLTMNEQ
ncbi:hypothetical protein PISMIDRAFT_675714 [Pisolithus microcarpus 441]|uniref:L-tryptophan decarboxylase PsiD-like domain-containing protein n=1 Tax=Pisolithus microcarpus 441 TaxID=765257 RepID=A0A0C9YNX5_9AGAM|nr:hypothetical protein PISMIDRAFT_675714 [Pisolithus microcarpus 441]